MPVSADDEAFAFLVRYRWFATGTVMLGMAGAIMASTMVNVAIPDIMGAYGVGQDIAHWMSTGFLSAMTVGMLANATLVGRFGPRNTFVIASAVFAVFSFVGQFGATIEVIILSRVMQGACAGLLQPLAMTIIYQAFPPNARGRAIGIFGMGIVIAPALGPTVGGLIVDHMSWPYVFTGALPFTLLGAAAALFTLPNRLPGGASRPFNWVSFILIAVAVASMLTALSNGQREGWTSNAIVLGFLLAILAGIVFIAWEMVTRSPLLQVRLFANPTFALSTVVAFVFGMGMFGSIYLMPLFARTVQHFTATKAGILLLPAGLIMILVFPIAGQIAQHAQARTPVFIGLFMFGVSLILLGDADANTAFMTLVWLTILGRVGLGLIMPALNLNGLRTLSPELLPFGAGTMNFVRMLGGASGVNITSVVLDRRLEYHRELLTATQTADNPQTVELLARMHELLIQQGLSAIDRTIVSMGFLRRVIEGQANALAHQDAFVVVGMVFMVGLLPALFLRGERSAAARPSLSRRLLRLRLVRTP